MAFRGFPLCPDGDVAIILNRNRTLVLHEEILSRQSSFFRDHFHEGLHALAANHSRKKPRWRVDLHLKFIRDAELDAPAGTLKFHVSL
jgi:hypothetical protein